MQTIRVAAVSMNSLPGQLEQIRDEMLVVDLEAQPLIAARSHPNFTIRNRRPELFDETGIMAGQSSLPGIERQNDEMSSSRGRGTRERLPGLRCSGTG